MLARLRTGGDRKTAPAQSVFAPTATMPVASSSTAGTAVRRPSTETERHLLAADSDAQSIISSRAPTSLWTLDTDAGGDGDRTPRAHSPVGRRNPGVDDTDDDDGDETRRSAPPPPEPYRGFASRAHYMAALQAWAQERQYVQADATLYGFYGERTMADYAAQGGPNLGLSMPGGRKWRAKRRERKMSEAATASGAATGEGVNAGREDDGAVRARRGTVA